MKRGFLNVQSILHDAGLTVSLMIPSTPCVIVLPSTPPGCNLYRASSPPSLTPKIRVAMSYTTVKSYLSLRRPQIIPSAIPSQLKLKLEIASHLF